MNPLQESEKPAFSEMKSKYSVPVPLCSNMGGELSLDLESLSIEFSDEAILSSFYDALLLRFLRARDLDIDKASTMLDRHLLFRKEYLYKNVR